MKEWHTVMAQLTRARLAVFDSLISRGEVSSGVLLEVAAPYSAEEIAEALHWLAGHYFVKQTAPRQWRARSVAHAEVQWITAGGPTKEFLQGRAAKPIAEVLEGKTANATGEAPAPF
jgi:hypothetical protein